MFKKDMDFVGSYIKKLHRVFLLIVGVVAVIELCLVVRGLICFDLNRLKHRLYLYSYLFLFLASAGTLGVLLLCRDKEKHPRVLVLQAYLYTACLIAWSTFVTCIDCVAQGDSGVMVYIMVCISVGVLMLTHPLFYSILLCASGSALVSIVWALRGQPYSTGFYSNFAIFILLAIFINAQIYRLNRIAFESSTKLEKLSITDQLTGIYNRRHLDEQVAAHTEQGRSYLFLLIDVDNFKQVNDRQGHKVGDDCLVLIARKLRDSFGDQVYRFGGDEFAVICNLDESDACQHIRRINEELIHAYDGIDLHLSAGAYRADARDDAGTVFICTDKALYQAKADGKSRCKIYTPE